MAGYAQLYARMEKLRRYLANWLGFSRTEVNGFLILIPLMILLVTSEPVYRWWISSQPHDFSKERVMLDSLSAIWDDPGRQKALKNESENHDTLFAFNPNKIDVNGLISLGFSKNLSTRIANYREKGGVFRVKRDLLKMYGIDSTLYDQLYTYILLPDSIEKKKKEVGIVKPKEHKNFVAFDINKADTAQIKQIYGIGNVLALRIVNFRNGLGGFIDNQQLAEVYGLDSVAARRLNEASFIETTFEPKKININTTDEKTLLSHPYIKKTMAKAILAYRFQHGNFSDVRDLLRISVIPPREAERLIPYLKVKD